MKQTRVSRLLPALAAASLLVGFAACTDQIVTGERPNRPSSLPAPESKETDLTKLAVPLTELPGYQKPTPTQDGFAKPMTGSVGGEVTWQVFDGQNRPLSDPNSGETVAFGAPSTYSKVPGVLTFRGNHARSAPTFGVANVREKKLEVVWTKDIGAVKAEGSYFPGAGWTGQPLLVQWPKQTKEAMGLSEEHTSDDRFVEVLYPVFDGHIYRLNLADGTPTKEPINAVFGFKGTGTIDPRGYPLLYAGQGLHEANGETGPWRYRIFDLISNTEISHIPGADPVAKRQDPADWGAFDSSALVNAATDTLLEPGENGVVYKVKLNSSFDPKAKTVGVSPAVTKMVYGTPISRQRGIESSAVAWRNLMFATDNDGNLVCWDATTLNVVWARADGDSDNADGTMVLDETPEGPFLYTGNSVGWRGYDRANMVTNLRKVNALTGEVVWQFDVPAYFNWHVKGGLVSSPLLGKGSASDLVVFNVAKTTAPSEGNLIALDKKTGKVVWNRHLAKYSWSSPVSITSTDGQQYGVYGDSAGLLHLFDMATGQDYSTVDLGGNIEASVAAFNDMLVVASYDKKIFGIKVS
ncbi:MAG: PQQ-binding-like beta-propeller repeat protein [Propionibacteriaceae bacterium]|nr:PQQ-binding-like beta-propeller repeat protein [Propionibacteriaceae bacterium]